jgi:hypothetical protein
VHILRSLGRSITTAAGEVADGATLTRFVPVPNGGSILRSVLPPIRDDLAIGRAQTDGQEWTGKTSDAWRRPVATSISTWGEVIDISVPATLRMTSLERSAPEPSAAERSR